MAYMKTTDSAVYVEKQVLQGSDETNWVKASQTTLYFKPKQLNLLSETTSSLLVSTDEIKVKDKLILIKSDNTIVKALIDSVDTEVADYTNTLDIFGDNSCIACFPLDGNVNDLGGNFTGSWSGTEQYDDTDAIFGSSAKFDGSSYVTLGDFTGDNEIKTISLWFKYGEDQDVIMNEDNLFCFIQVVSGGDNFYFRTPNDDRSNYEGNYVSADVEPNTWYHLVVINTGTEMRVYLNKEFKGSFSVNPFGDLTGLGLANTGNSSERLHGNIDQVRFFNRVLTEEEIETLYTEQVTKYKADISSLELDSAPSKVFQFVLPKVYIDLKNENQLVNQMTERILQVSSVEDDGIVVNGSVDIKDKVILNYGDLEYEIDDIEVVDADSNTYKIKLNTTILDSGPESVIIRGYFTLDKVSSSTTQFIGSSDIDFDLSEGDYVVSDIGTLQITSFSKDTSSSPIQYTIEFNEQSQAPEWIGIFNNITEAELNSIEYDSVNNYFKATFNDVYGNGNSIQRRILIPRKDVLIYTPFVTQMYKES